ncbi:MAG: D-glycero-beta-D-manno-heptose-7-phosphate kinase [Aquificaceae bacterium]
MRLSKDRAEFFFEKFKGLKVLVVGDVILDRYVFGRVERISPEAPVPIVEVEREDFRLGGAGNVASNLSSLGVKTYLAGIIGEDYGMHIVYGLLKEKGIQTLLVKDAERPTTEKTRIISLSQQLIRIDREDKKGVDGRALKELMQSLDVDVDGVILSDYAKGVVCKDVVSRVKQKGVFYSIDPKPDNMRIYRDAHLITPNEKEARSMFLADSITEIGWGLKKALNLRTLVITLGPKGMALFEDSFKIFPARAKQVYDVTGAGDTVIAVLTASYLAGASWEEACELANLCAGIVVGKLGTVTPSLEEVFKYLEEGEGL